MYWCLITLCFLLSYQVLPYDQLMQQLDVSNVRELEDFLINECMYAVSILPSYLSQMPNESKREMEWLKLATLHWSTVGNLGVEEVSMYEITFAYVTGKLVPLRNSSYPSLIFSVFI